MMPAAKRASYFFSAPSIALPPAPEAVPAPKNPPPSGRDILCHVMVVKVAKNKTQKAPIYLYTIY